MLKSNIVINNWKDENDYIKIMSIGTHPDHRSKGYAHRLVQYFIDDMKNDDIDSFKAETRVSTTKMQTVFVDFGYKIIDCLEASY